MCIIDTLKSINYRDHHTNVAVSRQCVYNRYTEEYDLQGSSYECGWELTMCVYNRYTEEYELWVSSYECGGE